MFALIAFISVQDVVHAQIVEDSFRVYGNYPHRFTGSFQVYNDTFIFTTLRGSVARYNEGYSFYPEIGELAGNMRKDTASKLPRGLNQIIELDSEYIAIYLNQSSIVNVVRIDTHGDVKSSVHSDKKTPLHITYVEDIGAPEAVNSYGFKGDTLFVSSRYRSTKGMTHCAFAYNVKTDSFIHFDFAGVLKKFPLVLYPNGLTVIDNKLGFGNQTCTAFDYSVDFVASSETRGRLPVYYYYDIEADTMAGCFIDHGDEDNQDRELLGHTSMIERENGTWLTSKRTIGTFNPGLALLDTSSFKPVVSFKNKNNPWITESDRHYSPFAAIPNARDSSILLLSRIMGGNTNYIQFQMVNKDLSVTNEYCIGSLCNTSAPKIKNLTRVMQIDNHVILAGRMTGGAKNTFAKVIDYYSGTTIQDLQSTNGIAESMDTAGGYLYLAGYFDTSFGSKNVHRVIRVDTEDWSIDTNWVFNHSASPGINGHISIANNIISVSAGHVGSRVLIDLNTDKSIDMGFDTIPIIYKMRAISLDSIVMATNEGLVLAVLSKGKWAHTLLNDQLVTELVLDGDDIYYVESEWLNYMKNAFYKYSFSHVRHLNLTTWSTTKPVISFMGQVNDLYLRGGNLLASGTILGSNMNKDHRTTDFIPRMVLNENRIEYVKYARDSSTNSLPQNISRKIIDNKLFVLSRLKYKDVDGFVLTIFDPDSLTRSEYIIYDPVAFYKVGNGRGIFAFDVVNDSLYILCEEAEDILLTYDIPNRRLVSQRRMHASISFNDQGGFLSVRENGTFLFGTGFENIHRKNQDYAVPYSWETNADYDSVRYTKVLYDIRQNSDERHPFMRDKYILSGESDYDNDYLVLTDVVTGAVTKLILDDPRYEVWLQQVQIEDTSLFLSMQNRDGKYALYEYSLKTRKRRLVSEETSAFVVKNNIVYYMHVAEFGPIDPRNGIYISARRLHTKELIWSTKVSSQYYDKARFWWQDDLLFVGTRTHTYKPMEADRILVYRLGTGQIVNSFFAQKEMGDPRLWVPVNYKVYFRHNVDETLGCLDLITGRLDSNNTCYRFKSAIDYFQIDRDNFYVQTTDDFQFDSAKYLYHGKIVSSWKSKDLPSVKIDGVSPNHCAKAPMRLEVRGLRLYEVDSFFMIHGGKDTTWIHDTLIQRNSSVQVWFNLDLTNYKLGRYEVIGKSGAFYYTSYLSYFEVEQPEKPTYTIQAAFPSNVRPNRIRTAQILISNKGNSNAYGVPLFLLMSEDFKAVTLQSAKVVDPNTQKEVSVFADRFTLENDSQYRYAYWWIIPKIPARSEVILDVNYEFRDFIIPDQFAQYKFLVADELGVHPSLSEFDSTWKRYTKLLSCYYNDDSVSDCSNPQVKEPLVRYLDAPDQFLTLQPTAITRSVQRLLSPSGILKRYIDSCYSTKETNAAIRNVLMHLLGMNLQYAERCDSSKWSGYGRSAEFRGKMRVINSWDPNNKLGPTGVLGLPYTNEIPDKFFFVINFENDSSASAPAQTVRILDTIDTRMFDPNSLEFVSFRVGDETRYFNNGKTQLSATYDFEKETGVHLGISSRLDEETGELEIVFQSQDPETGSTDIGALEGFLPPNRLTNEGQGSIAFFLNPRNGVSLDSTFANQAAIYFDQNKPIITNNWTLDYDTVPPRSKMEVGTGDESNYVQLTWSPVDSVNDVVWYDILRSTDGVRYDLVLKQTTLKESIFSVNCDQPTYFKSIAYDSAGNVESKQSYDLVVQPDCDSAGISSAISMMGISNDALDEHYFGPNTGSNTYRLKSTIRSEYNDTLGLKDFEMQFSFPQDYTYTSISFDSFYIDKTGYTLNNLDGIIDYQRSPVHYRIEQIADNGFALRLQEIQTTSERKFGFLTLDSHEVQTHVVLRFTVDGFTNLKDSAVCSLNATSYANQVRGNRITQKLIYDRSGPVLELKGPRSRWANPAWITWLCKDSISGFGYSDIKVSQAGLLTLEQRRNSALDSIDIFSDKRQLVEFDIEVCDNVLNCITGSTIGFVHKVSVEDITVEPTYVYPNPNSGTFTIHNVPESTETIKVLDKLGKCVSVLHPPYENELSISVASGVYLLEFVGADSTSVVRILVR